MARDAVAWTADALVLLGCLVMTIGVIGVIRMPDVYGKLHAASKSVFLGVCSILVAAIASGDHSLGARAVLIIGLLLLTTPVSAYEIARSAARELEPSVGQASEVPVAMVASERGAG